MWFEDQVLFPRIWRSFVWSIAFQEIFLSLVFLVLGVLSLNPFKGFLDWLFYMFQLKTIAYKFLMCLTTVIFGVINMRFFDVEKQVGSTRAEKICKALNPQHVQQFIATALLGGLTSYCSMSLFCNFVSHKNSLLTSFLHLENDFEHFFVTQHGCYTGIMFSLKYFICSLYIMKLTLHRGTELQQLESRIVEAAKESAICVLKSMHWYYLLFVLIGPLFENILFYIGIKLSTSDDFLNMIYSIINLRLLLVTFITGLITFFNWSMFLVVFNSYSSQHHIFPVEVATKSDEQKCLAVVLASSHTNILRYLAVLDLRYLAQHDAPRRKEIFDISLPGGHPRQWKAISQFCVSSLKQLVYKLNKYSMTMAPKESKVTLKPGSLVVIEKNLATVISEAVPRLFQEAILYLRERPSVAYFLDELPSTKIQNIFISTQPLIWIIEALGYLVAASYTEDKFGVVLQTLPDIICVLLDLKMAEEKLPIDVAGIRTHIRDPQGRYEHIHQRIALKSAVNVTLHKIADTFKDDIKGIYLPEEYYLYFQRYLNKMNL